MTGRCATYPAEHSAAEEDRLFTAAGAAVDALGAAFLNGDPDAAMRQFVSDGAVLYAGSEAGEVAVGAGAVQRLLIGLFDRGERYAWRTDRVWVTASGPQLHVAVEATLAVHPCVDGFVGPVEEELPYRVTGVLEQEDGTWRWRSCFGAELTSPDAVAAAPAPEGAGP